MIFAPSVLAMGGDATWYGDWWNNVYELRIEKEQYEKIKEEEKDRCSAKIRWYEEKVQEDPKSEYYKYKLEQWRSKCPSE